MQEVSSQESYFMREISDKDYAFFLKLQKIVIHAAAEKYEGVYFVCGEGGEKDPLGLPESIHVCPATGLDGFATYTKTREYSAPSW
jgi:hypothetical protein|tara:strand:+ start:1377 stop:1634 length:258 start_codon:yes stop_codon:yes gene_type:complete